MHRYKWLVLLSDGKQIHTHTLAPEMSCEAAAQLISLREETGEWEIESIASYVEGVATQLPTQYQIPSPLVSPDGAGNPNTTGLHLAAPRRTDAAATYIVESQQGPPISDQCRRNSGHAEVKRGTLSADFQCISIL